MKKNKTKSHESWKNYLNYHKDRNSEPLKNAVLQHPEEKDGMYDFMKKNVKRNMWTMKFEDFQKLEESAEWNERFKQEGGEVLDKWEALEKDIQDAIIPILDKYEEKFGSDSYAVVDAMYQILEGMFQRVDR